MSQISKLVWRTADVPEELHELLETLEEEYPVSSYGRGLKLKAKRVEGAGTISRVKRSPGTVLVEYNSIAAAARGIGSALGKIECDESTPFKTLGIMLDVSRNMVMRIDHLKMWLRRLALSGYNMVMLYTEDVYELPDEPFFGYMRGGYTLEELRELDAYARDLGIELVGCIQTLGHLEQILKWDGAYNKVKDTASVLMVDEPETYKLIEKMIRFWSEALTSRRIHIGMDETHDLGRGRFLDIHGYESGFELFNRHLGKVNAICKEAGLTPMIWSDMYFRLSNPNQDYYDLEHAVPEAVRSSATATSALIRSWDPASGRGLASGTTTKRRCRPLFLAFRRVGSRKFRNSSSRCGATMEPTATTTRRWPESSSARISRSAFLRTIRTRRPPAGLRRSARAATRRIWSHRISKHGMTLEWIPR